MTKKVVNFFFGGGRKVHPRENREKGLRWYAPPRMVNPALPDLLKFGTTVHYGPVEPVSCLKTRMSDGTGSSKWQCSANCHFSCLVT